MLLARFGVAPRVLGVDRLFAAAVAMALLEGRVEAPRPVPSARRGELGERCSSRALPRPRACVRPWPSARSAALEPVVPEPPGPELRRLVDATLARLLEELAGLVPPGGQVGSHRVRRVAHGGRGTVILSSSVRYAS